MNTIIRYMALSLIIFSLAFFCALHFWILAVIAGVAAVICLYFAVLDSWAADVYRDLFYKQLHMNEDLIAEMLDIFPKA